LKLLPGKRSIFKSSVAEFDVADTIQILPGQRQKVLPWFECCDAQPASEKAACQLAAAAPDLKHEIAAPDASELTSMVEQLIGIGRPTAVIFNRDLIEDLAVATCRNLWQAGHPFPP